MSTSSKRPQMEQRSIELGYKSLEECLLDLYVTQQKPLFWVAYYLGVGERLIAITMDEFGIKRRPKNWNQNKNQLRPLFLK